MSGKAQFNGFILLDFFGANFLPSYPFAILLYLRKGGVKRDKLNK